MSSSNLPSRTLPPTPQVLMIDADDTLWENNIYFERAIEQFIRIVDHPELSDTEVRAAFDALEASRVHTHGYGTRAFQHSLVASYELLTGSPCTLEIASQLELCAESIRSADLTLLHGVEETLPLLSEKHTVILVTKGDHEEQHAKLLRSGLANHFHHVEVLHEKHTAAYEMLLLRYGCDPAHSWMIGNSPRSDTNPALAAGMHAVYLPHPSTWVLEREPVGQPKTGRRLLQLVNFRELLHHFG